MSHVRAVDVGGRGAAEQDEGEPDLRSQELEDLTSTLLAPRGQSPGGGPSHEHGAGAERERLRHVGSAPYPTVEEHLDALADRLDDLRQDVEARGRGRRCQRRNAAAFSRSVSSSPAPPAM